MAQADKQAPGAEDEDVVSDQQKIALAKYLRSQDPETLKTYDALRAAMAPYIAKGREFVAATLDRAQREAAAAEEIAQRDKELATDGQEQVRDDVRQVAEFTPPARDATPPRETMMLMNKMINAYLRDNKEAFTEILTKALELPSIDRNVLDAVIQNISDPTTYFTQDAPALSKLIKGAQKGRNEINVARQEQSSKAQLLPDLPSSEIVLDSIYEDIFSSPSASPQ